MINAFSFFDKRNPAVFISIFVLLGLLFAFESPWALVPTIAFLIVCSPRKAPLFIILFILPMPIFQFFFPPPPLNTDCTIHFHIQSIAKAKTIGWTYKGTLKSFQPEEGKKVRTYRPCFIYSKEYISPQSDYSIKGYLQSENKKTYMIKSKKSWVAIKKSRSLLESRMHAKEKVKNYIKKAILQKKASDFLISIATGELEDKVLASEFNKLGLSHILAISGFHFGLLTIFLHFFLRRILPFKIEAIVLMGILTLYLIFLGLSPSIFRAWIMAQLFFLGHLIEKKGNSLNTLAVAMCIALIQNPFSCFSLGFQLSFLATAGIFLIYKPMEIFLQKLYFPKYPLLEALSHSKIWQFGYIFSSFFRKSISLSLAVNLAILPVLLSRVHSFPVHGLIYNLFFPFFTTVSMFLFLISLPIHLMIPFLGKILHQINSWYTAAILEFLERNFIPHKTIYAESMPLWVTAIYYSSLFLAVVFFQDWNRKKSLETNTPDVGTYSND